MNAVITGASKGIGRAIALELAKEGFNLAVCARNENDLTQLKIELSTYGVDVQTYSIDCAIKDDLNRFLQNIKRTWSNVDVLVNNAGAYIPGDLLDEPDDVFELQQNTNVNAVYYLSKEIGKLMRNAGKGHVFNICSIASKQIVDHAGSYSVTKAAMLSLNHVLRKELSAYGVKVTAILPGATLTSSWKDTEIPAEKFVLPEDVATLISTVLNLSSGVNVDEIVLTPLKFTQ